MNQKRDTFKKLVGVSTVVALTPSSWTKPIISSVILPSHAMTSTELTLNPIADVFLNCIGNTNSKEDCSPDDPRVEVFDRFSSLSSLIGFDMNIISGQNIDVNATYSIVNDPTESDSTLGLLVALSDGTLRWVFNFVRSDGTADDDVVPIGTFNLVLKVENPNGESATTSVNINFS